MQTRKTAAAILMVMLLITGFIYLGFTGTLDMHNWALYSAIVLILALWALFQWSQQAAITAKEIALISALTGVAALGRVPFAALPSVQPTTFLVIASGFVFGPQVGFLVGAGAALISNFFLGQGPWTPWQMIGWGLIGISAAWLGRWRRDISRLGIGVFGFVWGFVFGWMQNAGFWLLFVYPLNLQSYLATYVSSFFFDTAHALTNLLLCFLLFKPVVQVLQEYKDKMHCAYKDA